MKIGQWTTNPHDPIDGFYEGDARGLTKREYFAAMAMQGLIANHSIAQAMAGVAEKYKDWPPEQLVAAFSTEYADALIEALNK